MEVDIDGEIKKVTDKADDAFIIGNTDNANDADARDACIDAAEFNLKDKRKKYRRNTCKKTSIKKVKDKKLKSKLKRHEKLSEEAATRAAKVEMFLTEPQGYIEVEGMEKTWKISQEMLSEHLDHNSRSNIFSLNLKEFGSYSIDYTRDGRSLLLGGKKGHIASLEWKTKDLNSEFHVNETIRDVKWLHNETMYAVAQKKYTYIYDKTGMELHCLRNHIEATHLEFLPYHWLLASVGNTGKLVYQDTSTGEIVSVIKTRQSHTFSLAQNRYNSILNLGHANGVVSFWSPSVSTPLIKMLCHNGQVNAIAVDISGKYMATTGIDKQLKLWDIRNYKPLKTYSLPRTASSLSISDMGVLAIACGSRVHAWDHIFTTPQKDPYMTHLIPGSPISDVQFVPFEDVLGLGHDNGVSSIVIPGSGNPHFDTIELNPFRTKKQRQESEVHSLLDKLDPDMIVLDPTKIASFNSKRMGISTKTPLEQIVENAETALNKQNKKKSSSFKRMLKKKTNIIDKKFMEIRRLKNEEELLKIKKNQINELNSKPQVFDVLNRFNKKDAS